MWHSRNLKPNLVRLIDDDYFTFVSMGTLILREDLNMLDLRPANAPIYYYEGDDLNFDLSFQNSDGTAKDCSAWAPSAKLTTEAGTDITLTVDTSDAVNGNFNVSATEATLETASDLTVGLVHHWDMKRTDANQTVVAGRLHVYTDVADPD